MTDIDIRFGRWLLVLTAIVGLTLVAVAPVVSAHGNGTAPTADDALPYNGTASEWTAWMEARMTEHMGPGAVEWMEAHMGVTTEEMGAYMAANDGAGMHGTDTGAGMAGAGMTGYGHGGGC